MRIVRSLLLLCTFALTAAGCAGGPAGWTPAPWVPVAAAPARPVMVAPAPAPAPGIDAMVYGSVAPRGPAPARVAAAQDGRGLLMTGAIPAPAPRLVAAPIAQPAPRLIVAPVRPVAFAPVAPDNQPYTLDAGDRLRIVVFGQDGLSNSYVVDASGHIAMPLIGTVMARGATTDELSARIADRLRQGFIKEPHVAVEIEAYRPFFILGEVTQPGQYPYVANMTVETAVAIAGGFGPRAYRRTVTLTRVVHGAQVRLTVPVGYPICPGDTINVQERWF
jgi:polysaccharide biosynthesis/export protein